MTSTPPDTGYARHPDDWAPAQDSPAPASTGTAPAQDTRAPSPPRTAAAAPTVWPSPPPHPTPRSARWALAGLLTMTAVLYLWGLSGNGWANAFYSAAAQAGGSDWKAWFFGSLDGANSITVDKPPMALWLMGLSVRVFGLSSWSVLVPQALLGVASVGVLYATVRRWFGPPAGLIAGAVLALTPVATLMFRFNNPDAMLVFLLLCAAWAMGRATERGSWRWITVAGAFVGFAFLAKSLQALLVLPGFVAMYALAAPVLLRRRIAHLLAAFAAMVVAGGWWVAIVELWPASSRPYIGGSQTNSVVELIFGYNGVGRLTGEETGSVGGGFGGAGAGMWGETGIGRLFSASYGGQAAWLLPAALAMIGVLLWVSRAGGRTDLTRAAVLGWGGWLLVTGAVISFSQGIIHEYYTVALAPAIGALVGIGSAALWAHRSAPWARIAAAAIVAGSAWWAYVLLGRSASFLPWLPTVVLVGGLVVAAWMLLLNLAPRHWRRGLALGAGIGAGLVLLAGPAAYSVQTATSVNTGSLPSAGPAVSGGRGFGGPGARGGFGPGGGTGTGARPLGNGAGQAPGLGGPGGGQPPGGGQQQGQGQLPGWGQPGQAQGGSGSGNSLVLPGQTGQNSGPGPSGGAAGGLLNASTPDAALTEALLADADKYTWIAATVGSQSAAGYQLATQRPVMAIGGFNGSDPSPTLEQFQRYVAGGRIHYFIPSSGDGSFGAQNGGSDVGAQISAWVAESFTATTVGGTQVYDLSSSASGTAGAEGSTAI